MNNNGMPNGFNNIPGGIGDNSNSNNPMVDQANAALMGGQNNSVNNSSVMEGFSNVQNENNIVQGLGNVQNEPNVMQGMVSNSFEGNNASNIMPGQTHSGINSYTMQSENNQSESESNQNFVNELPEQSPVVGEPNIVTPSVETPNVEFNNDVNIDAPAPEPKTPNPFLNKFINENNANMNNIEEPVNPIINNMASETSVETPNFNTMPNMNEPVINTPVMPETNNNGLNFNATPSVAVEPVQEPTTSDIPSVDISTTNSEPINPAEIEVVPAQNYGPINVEPVINTEPVIPAVNAVPQPNMQMDDMNNQVQNNMGMNSAIDNTRDLNNTMIGVSPVNVEAAPIQNDINTNMGEEVDLSSKRKFPLSLRETILVTIALIGIIIVIIMYWPN